MMRPMRFQWFLLCLVAFAVVGCQRHSAAWSVLNAADKLMEERPDSALKMLEGISPDTLTHSEERAYHGLLLTQAQDKSYIVRTSDSLMLAVVDYYEHHRNSERLMRAYYYLGTVYEDLQDAPQAVDYYQRAIQVAPQGSERLQGLIYSRMGELLIYRRLREEGVSAYRKAYQLAVQTNDTIHMAHRLQNMGRAFASLHQADSCLYYYNLAIQYRYNPHLSSIKSEASSIYRQLGQYDKVRELIDGNPRAFNQWARYYQGVGMRDSAIWWFQQSRQWGNINAKRTAAKELSRYAAEEGRLADALQHLKDAFALQDSVYQQEQVENVKRIEALYYYKNVERERQQAILQQERSLRQLLLLSFGLAVALVGLGWLYFRYQQRLAMQREQEKRADYLIRLAAEQQTTIDQNRTTMEDMEKQIRHYQFKTAITLSGTHEHFPICHEIKANHKNTKYQLKGEQQRALLKEIDAAFGNFVTRLQIQCPDLTELELVICSLIKLSVPVTDIGYCLNRAQNTISTSKRRIFEKITCKSGSSKDLDSFLANF